MDLKIRDVAQLLGVSETTIRRWLADGKIPAYRLHHQYRFSRAEIENWMMNCKVNQKEDVTGFKPEKNGFSQEGGPARSKGWQSYSLYRAIHKGGVIIDENSKTKEEVIQFTTKEVAPMLNLDPGVVGELLLDREALMPTSLNQGLAVPHTRDCLLKDAFDSIFVVFPLHEIDWGALDGHPIHTAFFLFASDDRHHLNLLAKLAHLSSDPSAREMLQNRPSKQELLEFIKSWEYNIQKPSSSRESMAHA